MAFYEHPTRSVVKTITYRIAIIISTLVIVFAVTGNGEVTVQITSIATISSTIIYFVHERIWNNIHWGKTKNRRA